MYGFVCVGLYMFLFVYCFVTDRCVGFNSSAGFVPRASSLSIVAGSGL